MKSLLVVCAAISVLAGLLFYAVSGYVELLFVPAVVNFTFFGAAYAVCSWALKPEAAETEEDYSAYQSAHSL